MSSSHLHAFIDQFEGSDPASFHPQTLLRALANLSDPRAKRGLSHPLAHILAIMICAVITGAKTLVEIVGWVQDIDYEQLAGYGIRAPHATTIARVFQCLDSNAFELLLSNWAQGLATGKAIAVDGKEIRSVKNGGQDRVHLLAAIDRIPVPCAARFPSVPRRRRSSSSPPCSTIS